MRHLRPSQSLVADVRAFTFFTCFPPQHTALHGCGVEPTERGVDSFASKRFPVPIGLLGDRSSQHMETGGKSPANNHSETR